MSDEATRDEAEEKGAGNKVFAVAAFIVIAGIGIAIWKNQASKQYF